MGQSKLCRLCAEENDCLVRIYEEEGQKLNLATKITQCLQIWLYPEDPLPKTICIVCLGKLDKYFEFFETTSKAQLSLQVMFDPKVNNSKLIKKESSGSVSRSKNRSKEAEGKLENGEVGNSLSHNREMDSQDDEADTEPPELVECVLSDKDNTYSECKPTASRRKCRNPIKRTAPSKEREKVVPKERGSGKSRAQNPLEEDPYDPDSLAFQESLPLQERLLNMERSKGIKGRDGQRTSSRDVVSAGCGSVSKQTDNFIKEELEKEETEDDKSNVDTSLTEDEAGPLNQSSGSKKPRGEKKKNTQKSGEKPPRPKTVMEGYPWQCTTCPSILNTLQELRRHHQDVHQQPPIFKCVQCTKTYTRYRSFARHYKLHRNPKKYKCEECGKCFSQKTVLQSHSTVHTDARPHVCPQCGKAFKQFSSLYLHSKCHLPDQVKPKFPCDICNKEFATKHTLETHRKIHTGERNFICDICGKSFIAKGSLDYHILTHSGEKPHHCSVCGKGFKTARLLGKHATLHTGIKPHQCDVCGKQFRERGALREHNRIHTGAMPYTCEFCGKHFRFKGILTVHRRQHTGERPYGCAECRREFTNWANYNKHMKRRHRPPEAAAAAAATSATAASAAPDGAAAASGAVVHVPGVAVPVPNVISANAAVTAVAAVSHRDVYQGPEVSSVSSNCTNTVRAHQSVMPVNNVGAVSVSGAVAPSVPGSSLGSSYALPQHSAMCDNSNSSVNSLTHGMSPSGAIMPTGTSMYGTPNQGTKIGNIYGPPGTGNSLGAGIASKLPVPSSLSTMLHGSSSVVGAISGAGHKMPMSNVFHIGQHHNHESGDRVMERVMERSQPNNPLVGSYVPSYVPTGLPMGGMGYYIPPIHHAEHGIEMLHNRSGNSQ